MYNLSVVSIIKNNESVLKEWIEHYLAEGVNHIYLVDDNTTDHTYDLASNYKEYVTIIKKDHSKKPNTDGSLINNIYLNVLKAESKWVIFAGINEYMFSRNRRYWQLYDILKHLDENVEKIWVQCVHFGSSDYIIQPTEITKSFIMREQLEGFTLNIGENGRVICRTEHLVKIMREGADVDLSKNNIYYLCNGQQASRFKFTEKAFSRLEIHMNCYLMSKEYYEKHAADKYGVGTPMYIDAIDAFPILDDAYNKVEDNELGSKLYTYNPERYT